MAEYDVNGGIQLPRHQYMPIALKAMEAKPKRDPLEALTAGCALVAVALDKPSRLQ